MTLALNTNLNSLAAQRAAGRTQGELSSAMARLSSGLRINTARDDAAGLAIAERFSAQVRGTTQAGRNANDAISLSQTAEGALGTVSDALQRIRELAVQSVNASNSGADRQALQREAAQLVAEIDRVAVQTHFNGMALLDGSFAGKAFHVGANAGQTISLSEISSARSSVLGQYQGVNLASQYIGVVTLPPQVFSANVGGTNYALGTVAVDAKAMVEAVNKANIPGMTATANPTQYPAGVSATFGSGSGTGTFTINGVNIPVFGASGPSNWGNNRANAMAAINAHSATTGVVAYDTGVGLNLVAEDGRNITHLYNPGTFTNSQSWDFGLANNSNYGSTVNYSYVAPDGVTGSVTFTFGGTPNTAAIGATGTALSALDVSTAAGANIAITAADAALKTVNKARAGLGAVQNRFAATLQTLAQSGENLTAARGRIQDADFAMEAANLSRAQVLQQAGTAMIAQANQLPQQVLSLLR